MAGSIGSGKSAIPSASDIAPISRDDDLDQAIDHPISQTYQGYLQLALTSDATLWQEQPEEPQDSPTSGRRIPEETRTADLARLAPDADEYHKKRVFGLTDTAYLVWRQLAENVGTWHCRECLKQSVYDFYADDPEARDRAASQVASNGSNVMRQLRERGGFQHEKADKTHEHVCEAHPGRKQAWDRLTDVLPIPGNEHRRIAWDDKQKAIIFEHIGRVDPFTGEEVEGVPEIDHRTPRWKGMEPPLDISDKAAVRARYMPISSTWNKVKRGTCNKCMKTGARPNWANQDFWPEGGRDYDETVGCRGCFFYDPQAWMDAFRASS